MKRRMLSAAALAVVLMWTPPASGITVIDPTNLAQNVLQATRSLEQIHNQIQQIEQQAQMLAQNPLQLSPELQQSISNARQLFSQAQGLAFEVDHLSDQMKVLYPDTWRDFNLGEIGQRSDQWLAEDRAALERTMQAEAQAAQSLGGTQGRISQALQSSNGAQGQTSAVQASNQLLGIQATQLAQIQALLVAQSRALSDEHMERVAREQRAQEIMRRAFPTESNASLTPARSAFEH
ncbi:MAG: P-type conjugative transfer protein TrbJ [Vitreimonas sp.]